MVHHINCPLCSGDNIFPFLEVKDHFLSKKSFDLYKCRDCRFVFTQDYPEESEIAKFYESDEYISHSDSDKSFTDKVYRIIRRIMLWKKKNLIKKSCKIKTGSILDIGSGTGHFLSKMKSAGWKISGIEPNERGREYASSRLNIELLSPDRIKSLPSGSFDCITLWHVLEHFHEPFKYFDEIRRLLKPDGVVFVALPNCASFDSDYYSNYWAAYDVPRHLWHFEPVTFNYFLKKTGFKCEEIRCLPLDVFYISVLSEKYKGSSFSFIKGIITGKWFFLLSQFIVRRSSSLIYILRKSADQ
jgi:2-polyprenyl-3-methyl-5-hydroxy-6-metoxy-1,4-benzoquinol methylase